MLKIRMPLLIVTIAILVNCSDKEDALPLVDNEILTIEQLKSEIKSIVDNDILVQGTNQLILDGIEYTAVHLESKDSIFFKTDFLTSIHEEPKNWNINFEFADKTSLNSGFIGDSLYITSIELNPYSLAPLSAQVSLEMPVKGKFEIEVLGKGDNGIAIKNKFDKFDYDHELPALGLYGDFDNMVKITFFSEDDLPRFSEIHQIKTQEIDAQLNLNIIENNLTPDAQNIYFVSNKSVGFDQMGEIRWLFSGNTYQLFRKLSNGNLIIASRDDLVNYHPKYFYEITMLGEIVNQYTIPNNLHHEIRELSNGNFLVASNSFPIEFNDGNVEEDLIVEIDRESGVVLKTWDFNSILDPDRITIPNSRQDDWLHLNAFYFDEADESIVISGRNQSAIAKIDYHTSEVKWILANHSGWSANFKDKLLNPIDSDGNPIDPTITDFWLAGQHAPAKLPNGNIVVYDNGYFRGFYNDPLAEEKSYTRVVEFSVDESNMTVELVSSFTYKDINTTNTGDVDYLNDTEGLLIGFMNGRSNSSIADAPKILEISPNKDVLFEVDVNISAPYYRAERLFLYDGM